MLFNDHLLSDVVTNLLRNNSWTNNIGKMESYKSLFIHLSFTMLQLYVTWNNQIIGHLSDLCINLNVFYYQNPKL